MRKNSYTLLIILFLTGYFLRLNAQGEWKVPVAESEKLSINLFDEEMQQGGEQIYNTSCISCHGNPTKGNFTAMAPPPGDIATPKFQIQTDGDLLYKIQKGRGSMPAFENTYSESEIWSIVAYIRSFQADFKQKTPNLEGMVIPKLTLTIDFDENVDKLVVKVTDESQQAMDNVSVKGYLKGMFGNLLLGKAQTNNLGIAYFDVDPKLPGDAEGNVNVIIKATIGYASSKREQNIKAAMPTEKVSAIEGRHLWSKAIKAPVWMIIAFNLMGIGVWSFIFYIVIGLRKIKKLQ